MSTTRAAGVVARAPDADAEAYIDPGGEDLGFINFNDD